MRQWATCASRDIAVGGGRQGLAAERMLAGRHRFGEADDRRLLALLIVATRVMAFGL